MPESESAKSIHKMKSYKVKKKCDRCKAMTRHVRILGCHAYCYKCYGKEKNKYFTIF